ncbi:hypothetical protein CIL05_18415 [Virgibacillus profundi]|uniref:Uncharacterized protein n=1 Tax=Virgibacillus profundi TaxID=2024555 RepID=A0A2A2IAK7_9BACI|nr:hypothetical protein [Virgibacillus profundi]PAV28083.1 hypothetical protein CIL05_18415 [Virgibacillus profundi]PXY52388.1 hypothetical protein CIT14_17865 [Virgibacillus profundi]
MKLLVTQLIMIGVIWTGMAFFFSDMNEASKVVFYVVTSWLLFLIVIVLKALFSKKNQTK